MKRIVAILLCLTFVFTPVGVFGCSSSSQDTAHYTHTQNDGHLHEYIHKLHPDQYICRLCGKVYEGDPANLKEY